MFSTYDTNSVIQIIIGAVYAILPMEYFVEKIWTFDK